MNIDTTLRRYCQVCGQATISAMCAIGHPPAEYCTRCEVNCPVCGR